MLNIFKMDMRRTLYSKAPYSCIAFMLLVSGTMIFFGMLPDFASATGSSSDGAMDMTSSMMGIGMAFIMMSILFAICISTDFSSGFSKNIFSRHTNPVRYIGGKLLSLTTIGTIAIVAHTVMSMLLFVIIGNGVGLSGGFIGLLTYLIEKIFVSGAFAALILMVYLFTRQIALAMIVGVVVATGVVSALLTILGEYLSLGFISEISKYTISGLSSQATLKSSSSVFVTILIGSMLWVAVCFVLGAKALKKKDIS